MPKIFINYRRDDSAGYAGRIHETLASVFGTDSVFIDIDDIKPGVDFVSTIESSITGCDVMLVLIGKRWLDSRDAEGRRRLDDPRDFVHIEIERGLAQQLRILPVLIDSAAMPAREQLPADIGRLAVLEAVALSDSRWQYDMGQLVTAIGGAVEPEGTSRRRILALGALVAAAGAAGWFFFRPVAPAPDLSGRWVADVRYDFGVQHSEAFVLRLTDGRLSGTASFLGVPRGIVDGRVAGSSVSFTTRTEETAGGDSRQTEHQYGGTYSGDELRLSMQTSGGFSSHVPVDFVARRPAASPATPSTK